MKVRMIVLAALMTLAPPAWAQELPGAVPEAVGMSSERLARLNTALQDYVDAGMLPGAAAMVLRRGQVVYAGAFGVRDAESGDALEIDDIFRIASQSKAVVSVAAMILQEDGRLLISHPVSRYLPEFADTTVAVESADGGYEVVEATRPITVRDLLTHTAGVGYGGGPAAQEWRDAEIQGWYFAHRDEPVRETVRRMAALPFEAQPGERYVYGYSTDILGAVVEVAAGMPLDEFLHERIFTPLEMRDTHFYLPEEKRNRLTVVYSATEGGLERAPDPGFMVGQGEYLIGPRRSFSAGAGLLSTARDYARFLQMMLNGGELNGTRILAPKSVELMTVNHTGDLFLWGPGYGFGLGFNVLEDLGETGAHGSVGSYGWGGAYHSVYWVDPEEELVVVYFTQVIPTGPGLDDHAALRALVYQALNTQ
jgi:CubicO group peptidase (beta-lactamase class C family)